MVGRMNKVVVNKVLNIGMWVVLIGSVVHLISSDGPVDGGLVAVAILMAASLFMDSQKKRSGDKKRGG